MNSDEWTLSAACSDTVADRSIPFAVWVNPGHPGAQKAIQTCVSVCSVRTQCLMSALADKKAEGIRGGFSFEEGAVSSEDAIRIKEEFGKKPRRVMVDESGEV